MARRGAGPARPHAPEIDADVDPESVAREICLRLLAAAPRSRAELARALGRRRVPPAAAEAVLDRLTEVGLIDDAAFATAWVQSRHAGRGLGRRALAAELMARGVDRDVVGAAVAKVDPESERAAAEALVRRRLAATTGLDYQTRVRRLTNTLIRRGYAPQVALDVVRASLAAANAGADADDWEPSVD